MPRILLVKTSSMGDVIHNLPVATDIRRHVPGASIDWVVEESFSDIPRLHPAVEQVIPVAVRRWRKSWLAADTRREMGEFRRRLQAARYDVVLDTQGLLKSALVARLARGTRMGYDANSAREPLAALFYQKTAHVAREQHAVVRNRAAAALLLGYAFEETVAYGIQAPALVAPWLPAGPRAVLLHATSRDDKLWPEERWVELGRRCAQNGWTPVLPWGGAAERARSERLAQAIPGAVVPPALTLAQAAGLLSGATVTVGVDTGLVHLAAALDVPVVALYCATDPGLTGVYGASRGINLGGTGRPPSAPETIAEMERLAVR